MLPESHFIEFTESVGALSLVGEWVFLFVYYITERLITNFI